MPSGPLEGSLLTDGIIVPANHVLCEALHAGGDIIVAWEALLTTPSQNSHLVCGNTIRTLP